MAIFYQAGTECAYTQRKLECYGTLINESAERQIRLGLQYIKKLTSNFP